MDPKKEAKSPIQLLIIHHAVPPVIKRRLMSSKKKSSGKTKPTSKTSKAKKRTTKLSSTNTTGYTGVYKRGKRFRAQFRAKVGQNTYFGTYDTAKEAALAYDKAVTKQKLSTARLNFPNGLPVDDEDYEALMNPPKKKRKLHAKNTTGFRGVYKIGLRFRAAIYFDGRLRSLGTYATAKEAALGFDQAVVEHKRPTTLLNYPDGLPIDDVDYEAITNPKKKRKLLSSNTSGFNGVTKTMGNRFQSQIQFDRQIKHLGSYGTAKEAALAYDRAVTKYKLPSSKLNFPNGVPVDDEDDEVPVVPMVNPSSKKKGGGKKK